MVRSELTIDLAAVRANARRLQHAAGRAELWAVVKADGYGHGAADVARAALDAGARALCVATVGEAEPVRAVAPDVRLLVLGPLGPGEHEQARALRLELAISSLPAPEGLPVHLKVDTGMGRWGMAPAEALAAPREGVVGLMSHLATADEPDEAFAREQLARFAEVAASFPGVVRHIANSAATLRFPEALHDAVRCGIALYGLDPLGEDARAHGLVPALSWRSAVAHVRELAPGSSTGYGRRFVAGVPTRVGIVPVGYADGFRRGLTGTEVLVAGERRPVLGTVSMDAFAVELPAGAGVGAPVTLIGDGVLCEEHARRLGTIPYEVVCGIRTAPTRASRVVVGG